MCTSGATAFDVALISSKFDIARKIMETETFDVRIVSRPDLVDEEVKFPNLSIITPVSQPLLMFCRRLNLEAVRLLVQAGHDVNTVDQGGLGQPGRGALWHATLPVRPRANRLHHILVRRVRGDQEAEVRTRLVRLLLEAGARVEQEVLHNMATSLPDIR